MKVEIITGKYKPFGSDGWIRCGEVVELPDAEATAAIVNGVAKAIGESSSPQAPAPAQASTEPVATASSKSTSKTAKSEE